MKIETTTNQYGRRKFITDLSLASLSLMTSSLILGGCESILNAIENRQVRRMLRNTPEANHMRDLYRQAVQLMKNLPSSDKRNWLNQADIHKNWCPHRNWFFFPWHRVYLFELEKICRKLAGDERFALP